MTSGIVRITHPVIIRKDRTHLQVQLQLPLLEEVEFGLDADLVDVDPELATSAIRVPVLSEAVLETPEEDEAVAALLDDWAVAVVGEEVEVPYPASAEVDVATMNVSLPSPWI